MNNQTSTQVTQDQPQEQLQEPEQEQPKALVLAEMLKTWPGKFHTASAEELETQHAQIVELKATIETLQQKLEETLADAKRYQHAKMYKLLNGWGDENLDRDMTIHEAVKRFT
jgi:hypothetical protein